MEAHTSTTTTCSSLSTSIPLEVSRMSDDDRDPITVTRLRAELTARDATIDALRAQISTASEDMENVRRYALALHHMYMISRLR